MAPRGRKPKPTHLKLVTGNPGKRALNENEPKPFVAEPAKLETSGQIFDQVASAARSVA